MRVEIIQTSSAYWLVFSTADQMIRAIEHERLVDAINTASLLQVHITNIDTVKLSQYLYVS